MRAKEAANRFSFTDYIPFLSDSKKDKARIFGLNAAGLYGVNVKEKRNALPADGLSKLKAAYLENGGQRLNAAWGWVRDDA